MCISCHRATVIELWNRKVIRLRCFLPNCSVMLYLYRIIANRSVFFLSSVGATSCACLLLSSSQSLSIALMGWGGRLDVSCVGELISESPSKRRLIKRLGMFDFVCHIEIVSQWHRPMALWAGRCLTLWRRSGVEMKLPGCCPRAH